MATAMQCESSTAEGEVDTAEGEGPGGGLSEGGDVEGVGAQGWVRLRRRVERWCGGVVGCRVV